MSRQETSLALAVKPMSLEDLVDRAASRGPRRRIAKKIRTLICPGEAHPGGTREHLYVE
jgi:hypothetical protein